MLGLSNTVSNISTLVILIEDLELSNGLFIGIFYVDRRVLFVDVSKSQTGWRTKYDKCKFKEHIFK